MVIVIEAVNHYLSTHSDAKAVLFLDIDNTMLKMNDNLGSDQWFKWQLRLMQEPSNQHHRVARDLEHLQRIVNVIYQKHPCAPCEADVPNRLTELSARWGSMLRVVFITARAHIMYDTSIAQLQGVLGDKVEFDLITCSGDTKARFAKYYLDADPSVNAFFFVDDSHEHFAPFGDLKMPEMHAEMFHYTQQQSTVDAFYAEDKVRYNDMFNAIAATGAFDGLSNSETQKK